MEDNMRTLVLAGMLAVSVGAAWATSAPLTPLPARRTVDTCTAWARQQDDDAVFMWGQDLNKQSSIEIALKRLTASCLGRNPPEIVYFGSSAGFDDAFCRKHKTARICRSR